MSATPKSRVVTEALGGSPLSVAVQTRRLPDAIQPWWPVGVDAWRAHVEHRRGAARAGWLDRVRGAFAADGDAARRLSRVSAERGVVVTTGQQPGLFGGPLYALSKALSALAIADAIERVTGVAAAPVFWAATDDADFLEASVTFASNADGLHELRQDNRPDAGTPMSLAPLGSLAPQLERLRVACGSSAHARYFDAAQSAYSRSDTVGGAYVALMRSLLEPLGVAVLDASHASVRDAARPLLLEALSRASAVAEAGAARVAGIRAAGFEPQVEDDRGLSLVFAVEHGVKRRLSIAEAAAAPAAALAPNVLLRPVVERELLPTVAYVAGPGELAYFSQADAVSLALGRDRLVAVPRWSCTVLEPFVERALSRLGVQYQELHDLPAIERRLARASLPDNVTRTWKRLTEQVQALVGELARAVQESSLMPPAVLEGLGRSLAHRLSRAERRLLAAAKRRDDATRRDLTCAAAAMWPRGQRQERMLNFVPMLARGGDALVAEMRSAAADHARQLIDAPDRAAGRAG
jgi:bacillithiol biosynthesis cysteine-adding enzyme BshC